ncbi:4Fe-4S binding protein [Candidatus Bipolaricaulota bacterium]|nr:4Fe-4S binding protein [Candidatus Bipolaricaulota bacterium]TFH09447.1 MAG: 4Fe-4S binding protein [Candidatus Atribacteria bacterium]
MKIAKGRRLGQSLGLLLGFFGATGIGMTHLIFPGLHCYACPWAISICPIGLAQNLIIFGTVPYYWIGMMVVYGLAAGRGFCGWFCPFGTLNDLLSFRKVKIRDAVSYSKFLVLAATLIGAWLFADTIFCKLCPVASLEASIPYLFMGVAKVNRPFLIHMGTLAVTLVGMVLIARFWCRYLCPMGALLSLFNRVSFLKLRLDKTRCSGCAVCTTECPMGIEPHYQYDNHNCIKCGRCVDSCHLGALSMEVSVKGSE